MTITELRKSYNPTGLHDRFHVSTDGQERLPEELPDLDYGYYLRMTIVVNDLMREHGITKLPKSLRQELRHRYAKRCGTCATVLPLFCFQRNNSSADRLHSQCRSCNTGQNVRWYAENTEEVRERHQEWYAENAEAERERLAAWREQNPGYWESYYSTERGRLQKQLTEGYSRAVAAGNPAEKITPEDLLSHWEQQGINPLVCYLTEEVLSPQSRSIDHVLAISSGGGHVLDNLLPCTHTANSKKRDLSPEEALEKLTDNNEQETITNDQ